jgi:hypothetical protein
MPFTFFNKAQVNYCLFIQLSALNLSGVTAASFKIHPVFVFIVIV